jgi:sigma-B regulation protein RsbU (phosphoserine phosphatase)
MSDWSEHLTHNPLLRGLPASELALLQTGSRAMRLPAGTLLMREGEQGDAFYLILEGEVEIVKAIGTPEESLLGKRGADQFVGEMSLLYPDGLRMATARAAAELFVLEIPRRVFDDLLARQPHMAYQLLQVMSRRMSEAQDRAIQDLERKNRLLQQAYDELKAAQAQLIAKEKLERELQLAREIQMSILPAFLPELAGYRFGALIQPARAVGGDFYDFFELPGGRLGVVIGDVTDKGIPAAIFMAQTNALLRAEASRDAPPVQTLLNANRLLLEKNEQGLFATVIYGVLEPQTGEFHFARAGHELPLYLDASGAVHKAPSRQGMPLGLIDNPPLDEATITLEPGGGLLLFTDGLPDGLSAAWSDAQAPEPGDLLRSLAQEPAQRICEYLEAEVAGRQPPEGFVDDLTLVMLQRTGAL